VWLTRVSAKPGSRTNPSTARPHLVLIGPPGCGKGTQALRIAEGFGIPHISTGAILRAAVRAGSALGRQVAATIQAGSLVGDDVMSELVRDRLEQPDASGGFILDGFPRTVAQARSLDGLLAGLPLTIALIDVADAVILRRLSMRRVCDSCSITQSSAGHTDAEADPCPYCGGVLTRRQDDEPETIRHRLTTYAAYATPIVEYYRTRSGFVAIDGTGDPDAVTAALRAHLERMT
jgi:adenylate kinase